jgi:energy-coupling factor transporter ATP-binding protein EcfA2
MIKSITVHPDSDKKFPYWMKIPKLQGFHADFIKGFNILCGYNGCGKTTLLHLMRTLTFCEGNYYSKADTGSFAPMRIHDRIQHGYYSSVDLVNDWNKSCFNVRTADQLKHDRFDDGIENFGQFMNNDRLSSGMSTLHSIMHTLHMIKSNKSADSGNVKDFNVQVMRANLGSYGRVTLEEATDKLSTVKEYNKSHHVDTDCYTLFMDEPDRSLDVLGCDTLFNWMKYDPDKPYNNSFIAVLHNMSLIYRLRKHSGDHINWIELTPGYLDNVERFHENKPVQRPSELDWLLPEYRG